LTTTPSTLGIGDLGLPKEAVGLDGSPTRVARIAVPSNDRGLQRLEGSSKDMACQLLAGLRERGVLTTDAPTG
jgi:hypothetical protein